MAKKKMHAAMMVYVSGRFKLSERKAVEIRQSEDKAGILRDDHKRKNGYLRKEFGLESVRLTRPITLCAAVACKRWKRPSNVLFPLVARPSPSIFSGCE